MGHVDQSDVQAEVMGLTSATERHWGQKQLSFCIGKAVGCAHGNYNLDGGLTTREPFTLWHNHFVQELLHESKEYRTYKNRIEETKSKGDRKL